MSPEQLDPPPRPRRTAEAGERRRSEGKGGDPKGDARHLVLVVHGSRAESEPLRKAVTRLRSRGHQVDVHVTFEKGDATRFARDAVSLAPRAIVAVGGDGTVNEVLNGIAGTDVPLGIIPLGTANDFAKQARIPDNPEAALSVIMRREPVRIDTASLNGRRFLNVSTGGIGALATAFVKPATKSRFGPLAYVVSGVRNLARLRSYRGRFRAPGFEYQGGFLVFAVGNARLTGGGTAITPDASVTDGLLDVCVVEAMPRMEFARLGLALRRGAHMDVKGVHYFKSPSLVVESERAIPVNVDGEYSTSQHLEYRAHRLVLRAFLPRVPDIWRR